GCSPGRGFESLPLRSTPRNPRIDLAGHVDSRPPREESRRPGSTVRAMELLERERELAALDALVAEGGVLVVEGGAGIGKTALLEAAAARAAAAGRNVLRARGSELEGDFPFAVVRRLFERRLAGAAPAERRELLAGAAAVAAPVVGGTPGPGAADASFAVLHGLYWLPGNLAARGPRPLRSSRH